MDCDKNSNFINGGVDFLNKVLRNVGYFMSSIAQNWRKLPIKFSFQTFTSSGTVNMLGAKFQIYLIPASTSLLVTSWATLLGSVKIAIFTLLSSIFVLISLRW